MSGKQNMPDRDIDICAYLDGSMSAAAVLAFEQELESNPELAETVIRWQSNDHALKSAVDAQLAEPVDQALLSKLGLADKSAVSNVFDFNAALNAHQTAGHKPAPVAAGLKRWYMPLGAAIAAGLAALVIVNNQPQTGAPFNPEASKAFQMAMQEAPASVRRKVDTDMDVFATLSFVDGQGRFCREFVFAGARNKQTGIACKAGDTWRLEAIVKGAPDLPAGNEIHTAGGAEVESLEAIYQRLKASDPLRADQEKDVIQRGWKK
jgi:hypothetical protein